MRIQHRVSVTSRQRERGVGMSLQAMLRHSLAGASIAFAVARVATPGPPSARWNSLRRKTTLLRVRAFRQLGKLVHSFINVASIVFDVASIH